MTKIMSEEQALRLQIMEMMGWNKPGLRVPGVRTNKNNDGLYAVFMRPFLRVVNDIDQVTRLYFSKDENQQLTVLVTENRAFDKENIGQLQRKSNITLTVWENGRAIWHNESALSQPLYKNMENDPSWDAPLSQGIRKTIIEGVKMEKESPYSYNTIRRRNKTERVS